MPTLNEIRDWLGGEKVEKLPEREGIWDKSKEEDLLDEFDNILNSSSLKEVNVKAKRVECANCRGSGTVCDKDTPIYVRCKKCDGRGYIELITDSLIKDKNGLATRVKAKSKSAGRYTISTGGDNALLKFGRHKGKMLTQIIDEGNSSYLDFILKESFPEELKDVCRYLLRTMKSWV